jgi:predicted nucleotidyltransferase
VIQRSEIKTFVRKLAREFNPERVILFGSYAHGKPTDDSDVDLLVVANYRGDWVDKAVEMRLRIPRKFPLDLIVRRPSEIRRRLAMKDSFVSTMLHEGKVLYERRAERVDRQSRR